MRKKTLTKTKTIQTMNEDRARRLWISHDCRGVSPRWSNATHTSPRFQSCATTGVHESRASKVIRRRALSAFHCFKVLPA